MGRFGGESCGSYLLYINVFIGLRTEFKRKATCSVVEPELHVIKVTQISQI